jgi:hypothetical protein
MARALLVPTIMNFQCQHCGQPISGKAYRVVSEEYGVTLLDMTVCYYCFTDAKRLGLDAKEMRTADVVGRSQQQSMYSKSVT